MHHGSIAPTGTNAATAQQEPMALRNFRLGPNGDGIRLDAYGRGNAFGILLSHAQCRALSHGLRERLAEHAEQVAHS